MGRGWTVTRRACLAGALGPFTERKRGIRSARASFSQYLARLLVFRSVFCASAFFANPGLRPFRKERQFKWVAEGGDD
jgi:hypothetical protein